MIKQLKGIGIEMISFILAVCLLGCEMTGPTQKNKVDVSSLKTTVSRVIDEEIDTVKDRSVMDKDPVLESAVGKAEQEVIAAKGVATVGSVTVKHEQKIQIAMLNKEHKDASSKLDDYSSMYQELIERYRIHDKRVVFLLNAYTEEGCRQKLSEIGIEADDIDLGKNSKSLKVDEKTALNIIAEIAKYKQLLDPSDGDEVIETVNVGEPPKRLSEQVLSRFKSDEASND